MTYREALNIGMVADGTIKCTYAILYDETGKKLFSLQRRDAIRGLNYTGGYSDASSLADIETVDLKSGVWVDSNGFAEDGFSISVDIPLVSITGEPSNKKFVPCMLIDGAKDVLANKLANTPRVNKFEVYKVFDNKGTRKVVLTTYHMTNDEKTKWEQDRTPITKKDDALAYHHEIVVTNVLNPRYQKLIELIKTNGTFYIKPAAFNWQVVVLKEDADITYIDEDGNEHTTVYSPSNLAKLKDEYEKAKAILLGSFSTLAI